MNIFHLFGNYILAITNEGNISLLSKDGDKYNYAARKW